MKKLKALCTRDDSFKFPCLIGFSLIFLGALCAVTNTNAEENITLSFTETPAGIKLPMISR